MGDSCQQLSMTGPETENPRVGGSIPPLATNKISAITIRTTTYAMEYSREHGIFQGGLRFMIQFIHRRPLRIARSRASTSVSKSRSTWRQLHHLSVQWYTEESGYFSPKPRERQCNRWSARWKKLWAIGAPVSVDPVGCGVDIGRVVTSRSDRAPRILDQRRT